MKEVYIDRNVEYTGINGDNNDIMHISLSDALSESGEPIASVSFGDDGSDVPLQDVFIMYNIMGLFLKEISSIADAKPGDNIYLDKWISMLKRFKTKE